MTREEFLIRLGIEMPRANDLEPQIDALLEKVRQLLNQNVPNLNIQVGNYDDILREMSNLGTSINSIVNQTGGLDLVNIAFDNTRGTIVSLNSELRDTTSQISILEQNLNKADLRKSIKSGNAFDENHNQVTDARKTSSVAYTNVSSVEGNVQYLNNINAMWREYQNIIRQTSALEKQRETALRNENQEFVSNISRQLQLLQNRKAELESTSALQQRMQEEEKYGFADNSDFDRQQKSYANIEKYIDQINKLKVKSVDLEGVAKEKVEDQIKVLQEKVDIEKQIATLNSSQVDRLEQKTDKGEEAVQLRELQIEVKSLEDGYKELYQTKLKLAKSSNNEDDAEVAYLKEVESLLQNRISETEKLISSDKRYSVVQEQVNNIQKEYNENLKQAQALKDKKQDDLQIEKAVKATQELLQAEKELVSLKKKKADNSLIEEQAKYVSDLKNKLEQLTSATLSNGKSVKDTERYTEEYNKTLQELARYQRQAEAATKEHSSVLGTLSGSFGRVIENVVKYNLAQFGLEEILQRTITTIKDLDSAMMNIRVVTGESAESARQTMLAYSDLAIQLGATTEQIAESNLEWLRQGYTAEEANGLVTASTMLSKLGMIEAAEATTLLTATMNGFQMSTEEAMSIVDKLVNVD